MTQHILIAASYSKSVLNFRGPLIRHFLIRGWRVSVTAPEISEIDRARLTELGASVYDISLNRRGLSPVDDLRYFIDVAALARHLKPDLLLTYTIKPNIWATLAASSAGIKSVSMITGLGSMFIDVTNKMGLRFRIMRWVASSLYSLSTKGNAGVIFQNNDDLQDFLSFGCLDSESKAIVVPGSGVDLNLYTRVPLPSKTSFLMISRLIKSKGVLEYIEASLWLKKQFPEVEIGFAGPIDEGIDSINSSDLERWVKQGLRYYGEISDIRVTISEASVIVLPSYREGTPRSVLEGMAMGRAIITTDVPGCRDTVIHGKTGLLVPARDVSALHQAMKQFVLDPTLAERFGNESYNYAVNKYDVSKVNELIFEFLSNKV